MDGIKILQCSSKRHETCFCSQTQGCLSLMPICATHCKIHALLWRWSFVIPTRSNDAFWCVWRFLIWRFSNKVCFGDAIWRLSSKVSFVICRFSLHFGGFLARSSGGGRGRVCVWILVIWTCPNKVYNLEGFIIFWGFPTRSNDVCVFVYVQFCWFHSIFVLLSCYVFWNLCVQQLCCNVKVIFVHCITFDLDARECVHCWSFIQTIVKDISKCNMRGQSPKTCDFRNNSYYLKIIKFKYCCWHLSMNLSKIQFQYLKPYFEHLKLVFNINFKLEKGKSFLGWYH
jgi:hypothetical protein